VVAGDANVYDRNTTTPVLFTVALDANGKYTFNIADGRYDVEVVTGTQKYRRKYDDQVQLTTIETANLRVRNPAGTFKYDLVPAAITADRTFNMPLITGTDTLAALGVDNIFTPPNRLQLNGTELTCFLRFQRTNDPNAVCTIEFAGNDAVVDATFRYRTTLGFEFLFGATQIFNIYETAVAKIAGSATRATTEGTNHLDIFDGTAPVGTLANGISLYSTAGELRVMDAGGAATLLSPHDDDGFWVFDSVDTVTGRRLKIDVERLLRALNDRFGYSFVHDLMEVP
jgi:hypothetical protein